ncbi:MAG TPA: hypothetical protein VM866_09150 [Pyrinomonadaceae bacterium]|jgi:hypothetical protein|nr:hypothetical protein [Pyrinomonadaceae bacterium]
MRVARQTITVFLFTIVMTMFANKGMAAINNDPDTDTRIVEARVVEATDTRISVVAQTGVEHVIAVDGAGTKVKIEGQAVSPKDVRVGDIITVELDEMNPVKFAKNIDVTLSSGSQVARARQ